MKHFKYFIGNIFIFIFEQCVKVLRSFTISNLRKRVFAIDFNGYLSHLDGKITSECCLKLYKYRMVEEPFNAFQYDAYRPLVDRLSFCGGAYWGVHTFRLGCTSPDATQMDAPPGCTHPGCIPQMYPWMYPLDETGGCNPDGCTLPCGQNVTRLDTSSERTTGSTYRRLFPSTLQK